MSVNRAISAAKNRRTNPPTASATPGQPQQAMQLPPQLRNLPPQVQMQMMQQMMAQRQAAAATAPPPVQMAPPVMAPPVAPIQSAGPYQANMGVHQSAMVELEGVSMRDLPISNVGLPCLPSGAPLPPNALFKMHHDQILIHDSAINDFSNRFGIMHNRLDKLEKGGVVSSSSSSIHKQTDASLANNEEFIVKVVDNILQNTNLSDIINQIEPLQKENTELRNLLMSQQKTLNELSTLVFKYFNYPQSMENCVEEYNCATMEDNLVVEENNLETHMEELQVETEEPKEENVENSKVEQEEVKETETEVTLEIKEEEEVKPLKNEKRRR